MKIRKATIKDFEEVKRLLQLLFKHELQFDKHFLDMKWTSSKNGKKYITKMIDSKDFRTLVIEDNGILGGYMTFQIIKPEPDDTYRKNIKMAELDSVYLDEKYRRKGLATQMIKELAIWAKDRKANRLTVGASHGNGLGINFYKKAGFKEYELILEKDI